MAPSPKPITSAANPAVKRLKSLAQKKYRDESGLFLLEGQRHVEEALAAGWRVETLALSPAGAENAAALAAQAAAQGAALLEMPEELLQRITGRDNAQPVVAALRQRLETLDAVAAPPPAGRAALWIALEDIRDPGNLGTILRTADAVAAAGVLLVGRTCDPFAPETIRASMGAFCRLKIARAALPDLTAWRGGWHGRLVGTHLQTQTDYRAADYAPPLMLVMGGEKNGLSAEMAALCDTLVRIPMPGGTESLNLAVSTGIMLYEICRNRL